MEFDASGGGVVITGTRIILPAQIASIAGGVVMPVSGSLNYVGTVFALGTVLSPVPVTGTLFVATIGTLLFEGNVNVGTVGTIQFLPNMADVGTIGTILSPVAVANSSYIGTIGTILAFPDIDDVDVIGTVGTILSLPNMAYVGTVGTILFLPNMADVGTIGTILSQVTIGTIVSQSNLNVGTVGTIQFLPNLADVGTVGTILFLPNMADVGTIGTIISLPTVNNTETSTTPAQGTVSGSITGASGTLYGIIIANPVPAGGAAGTLLLSFSGASPTYFVVPAGDIRGFTSDKGIAFTGSLVASLQGTLNYTVLH